VQLPWDMRYIPATILKSWHSAPGFLYLPPSRPLLACPYSPILAAMTEEEKDSEKGHARHDELFKKIIGKPGNARDLLVKHLPPEILAQLDMDTLQRVPATFIDEKLKKHYADLVYSVQTINPKCPEIRFYLLFEHKTWPDDFVGVQVLRYMSLLWTGILEDKNYKHPKLPPILPIVFYQSNDGWMPRTSFRDLIYSPSQAFDKYIPNFTFDFIAATRIDPKAVQDNVILKFYVAILRALDSPELVHLLPLLVEGFFEVLEPKEAMEYILVFFQYLVKTSEMVKERDFKQALATLPEGGKEIMNTLADQWMRQGREDGLVNGRQEGELKAARTMLLNFASSKFEYVPVGFSQKIHAIKDIDVLNSLSHSLPRAESLEAFEALIDKASKPTLH
jgi:predicted transposase/invertase (TIGR01784 family)